MALNKSNDAKDTPINTIPKKITFKESLRLALLNSSQPLTVTELTELASREHGKAYDEVSIRNVMNELVAANQVSYRTETKEERSLRSASATRALRSVCAKLYWSPVEEVPTRTVPDAVPGFLLFSDSPVHYKKYDKYKSKRHNKSMDKIILEDITPYEAPVNQGQNQMVDYLIEKMVAERVAEITVGAVKELEEARAELARLREFIKSSL